MADNSNIFARNLESGQYQYGSFVFGYGTMFPVESFDIGAYEVNAQDFQIPASDEIHFGQDTLKPMPIQITINELRNFALPNIIGMTGTDPASINFDNDKSGSRFAFEWRNDEDRQYWGRIRPMLVCRETDGRVVRVYGRPGKLAIAPFGHRGMSRKIVAEFRRSDTLAYSNIEWYSQIQQNETLTIVRSQDLDMGSAPSWLRILLVGPMVNPIIQLGSLTVQLAADLDVGDVYEISSYPWERRVLRLNDNQNKREELTQPYLDKLKFPANSAIEISWNATEVNTQVQVVNTSSYSNGAVPSASWNTQNYGPGNGGWVVQAGKIIWVDGTGNAWNTSNLIYKTPSLTKWQRVSFTQADAMESSLNTDQECENHILGRSTITGTEYLYWTVTYTHAWFGVFKNGVEQRLSPKYELRTFWDALSGVIDDLFDWDKPGDTWKYEAEFGTAAGVFSSSLRIQDVMVCRYEQADETLLLPDDSAHKYSGIGGKATARALGTSTPGSFSKFTMRDNPPSDVAATLGVSGVFVFWRDVWQTI